MPWDELPNLVAEVEDLFPRFDVERNGGAPAAIDAHGTLPADLALRPAPSFPFRLVRDLGRFLGADPASGQCGEGLFLFWSPSPGG
jgi:hypothetical protein